MRLVVLLLATLFSGLAVASPFFTPSADIERIARGFPDAIGASVSDSNRFSLHKFDIKSGNVQPTDPVCLDGSPAGVYVHRATSSAGKRKFAFFFQGGGWCSGPQDCKGRAGTDLGSSLKWGNETGGAGPMDPDCSRNPLFCDWNLVILPYCDGNSFTGSRDGALVVDGQPLYFRGAHITEAAMRWSVANLALDKATDVLLSGCSAGGLATILNTNRVGAFLQRYAPALQTFKAIPLSGVFLDVPTVTGVNAYATIIRSIVDISSPRYTLIDDGPAARDPCLEAHAEDPAACHFAQNYLPHVRAPMLVVNSAIDSWELSCILTVHNGYVR